MKHFDGTEVLFRLKINLTTCGFNTIDKMWSLRIGNTIIQKQDIPVVHSLNFSWTIRIFYRRFLFHFIWQIFFIRLDFYFDIPKTCYFLSDREFL